MSGDVSLQIVDFSHSTAVILSRGLVVRPVAFAHCPRLQQLGHLLGRLDSDGFQDWARRVGCGTTEPCHVCYLQIQGVSQLLKIWLQDDYHNYVENICMVER